MDVKELKKIVCQNLRSVTQSCKGGVPISRLQSDYKALLGNDIPYKKLGYDSLESFIWNIPDVVRIKMYNGQRMVEGVVDPSTAHIANMISRQKKAKGIGLKKPPTATKRSGGGNQKHTPTSSQDTTKVQVHTDKKMEDLKKAVLINLRVVTMSKKDGVLLQNLQGDYHTIIGTPIPFDILGYDSLESFIRSVPDVINLKMNFSGQLVAEAVFDAYTAHILNLSRQKQRANMVAQKNKSSKPKSVPVSQKSEMSSVESLSGTYQSSSSSKDVPSRSITPQNTSKENVTTNGGDSVRWSGRTLGSFPSIKDNITNAHFSTLLGLHNILFGVSYMDTLKESILKFGGYLFLEDSEEWKKREFLLSVLPTNGLNEYLNLLCVKHCDTEEKHALLSKLLSFIASLRTEMIDPNRKITKKLADSDLYKKCHEKDKQIREVMQENENLKAELLKIRNDQKKLVKERSLLNSTNSEAKDNIIVDQSVEIDFLNYEVKKLQNELTDAAAKTKEKEKEKDSLKNEVKKLQSQLIDAAAKTKEKEKEKGKFECELNELRHDRKVDNKTHEKQKMEFFKYITHTSTKMEKLNISHAAEIKAIQQKLTSYESVFDLLKRQTAILKNEIVSRPLQHTTITLPLINQLLGILNEVPVQTQPQQSLPSA